jgi:hypothetical protein
MRRSGVARQNVRVVFGATFGERNGMIRQFFIPNGRRDADPFCVIGHLVWIKREDTQPLLDSLIAKPHMRTHGVALAERK